MDLNSLEWTICKSHACQPKGHTYASVNIITATHNYSQNIITATPTTHASVYIYKPKRKWSMSIPYKYVLNLLLGKTLSTFTFGLHINSRIWMW